jgi:hypothetical protein
MIDYDTRQPNCRWIEVDVQIIYQHCICIYAQLLYNPIILLIIRPYGHNPLIIYHLSFYSSDYTTLPLLVLLHLTDHNRDGEW